MLSNCEKMVVIPPTSNQWPQSEIDDRKISMASSGRVMEKASQELLQQQQALKCPRCDSSNTKFCYYNNYSLSQPRHFCKACKRYWTKGGTLRNVPVGGGCRKNKRVKRPTSSITSSSSSPSVTATSHPASQPQIDAVSTSNHISPLFYGLSSNSCDVNLQFPRFNSRISSPGYDLRPQMNNALGLGFMSSEVNDNGYRNGFTSSNNTTTSLLSNYDSIFSSSSNCTSTASVMPSLLLQHKFMNGGVKDGPGSNTFQGLSPLEQVQRASNSSEAGMVALKDVKVEGQNRLEWNGACQNQIEHVGLYDPSLYWNTATAMGFWNDQANNIGPSVTSLI